MVFQLPQKFYSSRLIKMETKFDIRKCIYGLVGTMTKSDIVKTLKNKNISRSQIYRAISDCENGVPLAYKQKSGRNPILSTRNVKNLVKCTVDRIGASTRKLGRKFGVSHMTVQRILKKNSVNYRKRKKVPKYNDKQLEKIPKCCRALRLKHFKGKKVIVLDDEKYFTFSNSCMSGNDGFYTSCIADTPNDVKYKGIAKFEPKIMVWCAISSAGVSEAFIGSVRGQAVNSVLYIKKCLPKMIKFIQEHHKNDDVIFWPDLASCHYSKETTDYLKSKNVKFVPKLDNPPNVPQARPIENFWAVLSRMVYENGWEAKSEKQLRSRIKKKLREVDINVIQRMIGDIKPVLRKIEDNGPFGIF